eukprot:CAMPEP_0181535288 /NCGR_PEP_ID=MMETSP1110-20121109/74179_1 /TAXON_ID=174948 /ORGANISM="Symbiodinium sp., Strain CCMP421" /LENGTH=184 /DNA_ID=CAMNT_0023666665 /DNA_START=66 /DNA_END=620 /DNA_ORIENTATION=-
MRVLFGFAAMVCATAENVECTGEGCLSMMQEQVIAHLKSEDSVERFMAALDEGDAQSEAEAASLTQDKAEWGGSPTPSYGNYGSSYGSPYGGNPYGSPYGGSPYGTPPYGGNPYGGNPYGGSYGYHGNPYGGAGGHGCLTKIQSSSCLVFDCAKSRGPTHCNTQDYTCYCQPGYCSDGHGCMPR